VAISYDRSGGQTNITDAGGSRTRTYNVGGELQTEQITGGILNGVGITVGYDGLLRRSSLQTSQGATTLSNQAYGYDLASRLETITSGSQTATYVYYPNSGLLNTTTFTGGTNIARNYDTLGRLQSTVTTPAADAPQSYTFVNNNLNQRTRVTREDGSYWSYIYNDRGELVSGKKYWADNSLVWGAQTEHNFDNIGNRNYAKTGGNLIGSLRQSNYTANSLNQYTQRTVPGAFDITGTATTSATVSVNDQATARKGDYFYKEVAVDNASPVYSQVKVVGARNNFGAGGEDAVTEKGGLVFTPQSPEASAYDLDGNLISDGRWIYSWDAEDRLISMETIPNVPVEAKQRLEFAYDYMSRRIQKKVYSWNIASGMFQLQSNTRFVYDGWNLIAEIDGNNSLVRSYVRNGADLVLMNVGGDVHQVGHDGDENVTVLVKASTGRVSAFFDYDPFGQTLKAAGEFASQNPFRFSNQYTDGETGLVYYGYRYYNPQIGRWISRDPSAEASGANLYGFLGNDSLNGVDSLGLWRRVDEWKGGRSVYSGSVEADCNDNLRQLAILITGDPNDWKALERPEKVQQGENVKVGKLLAVLEEKVRYSIVAATRRFNPEIFSVKAPPQAATAEATVNQYFTGTKFGISDCSTAELLVRAKGIIDVLKPGEFNALKLTYSNLRYVETEIDGTAGQMLLGDAGTILNYSDYSEWSVALKGENRGYKAENIIKVGPGSYWGFEGPEVKNRPRTELQWRENLRQQFNDLGGPQRSDLKPIHFAGKIRFTNIAYLGMVVFELRASKLQGSQ
jgi:RHS repeat-associated protein